MRYTDDQLTMFIHHSNLIESIEDEPTFIRDVIKAWNDASTDEERRMIEQLNPPEIIDHYKAILFAIDIYEKKFPHLLDIHLTHEKLMGRILTPSDAGFPRRVQVYIGRHVPPAPGQELMIATEEFYQWLLKNLDLKKKALEKVDKKKLYSIIYEAHCKFEELHPYIDGNGRSGRILWLAFLHRMGFDYTHIHIFDRYTYYDSLNDFRWVDNIKDLKWIPPKKPDMSSKPMTMSGLRKANRAKKTK